MHSKRLSRKHAVYTPGSGTTVLVNYDSGRHVLEVEFTGGEVYHYLKVPAAVWEEYQSVVKAGESSGTFVNKQVKPFYDYIKITE